MKHPTLRVGRTHLGRRSMFLLGTVCWGMMCACSAVAQSQAEPPSIPAESSTPAPAEDKTAPEMTSHDEATTFKVNVRLVLVRVVVRDPMGHAVGDLHKQDFRLFDNHKPQVISQFSVEQPGSQVAREQEATEIRSSESPISKTPNVPERFIAYLFDDIHLQMEDLLPVRTAADRRLKAMQPTDRAAIFTTSGQNSVDFTDDRAKLHQALLGLQPHPLAPKDMQQCPYMSYYMADLIMNKNDAQALDNATRDAMQCGLSAMRGLSATQMYQKAQVSAEEAAEQELSFGDSETHLVLASIKDVMRRVAAVPGQRTVVLVSPGFLTYQWEQELTEVIDQAIRTNIMVSTLDARGLYVPPQFADVSQTNVPNLVAAPQESLYQSQEASADDEVLLTLAESTGGTYFHNNNDLEGGLKQAAETPAYYYVLGFAPQNLKYDGRFHSLNVKLANPGSFTLEARRGYYAPKQPPNAEEEAKQEIQEALFSQEEMRDLPVDLHTQFFKPSDTDAKLSVLVHVDVKRLHFQRLEGRNNNNLTIVAALFDRNGSFVEGNKKILEMHWKDDTLEHKLDRGVTLRTNFDVKPGSYLVRLVVRDNEGLLSAENGAIEIP
ncbi:MAG TPA: VWA domain-containing protein [Terriglobales bacterium]|nr:VWA domain-containing protein [Terriglobales bacterium]